MIFGDPLDFAIELEKTDNSNRIDWSVCKVIIWINGHKLGTDQEETLSLSVVHYLKRFLNHKFISPELLGTSAEELITLVRYSEKYNKHLANIGPSFDDFTVVVFRYKDCIQIVFKLSENPYFEYDLPPNAIFQEEINLDSFETNLVRVESFLRNGLLS